MKWAALVTWLLTASGGFVLLVTWIWGGGLARGRAGSRIRPALVFPHFGLAAGGLVVWVVYALADVDVLAWIAFGMLAVVASIGWTMFGIWSRQRSRRRTGVDPAQPPPEQRFPVPVVVAHGLLAVTTVVLVFLTALTG
jgi:hypothetical protein